MSISNTQPGEYDMFFPLIPPKDLVFKYKNKEITWKVFSEEYKNVLNNRKEDIIEQLNMIENDVTFCCWEKMPHYCHRIIAYEFLKDLGYEVDLK